MMYPNFLMKFLDDSDIIKLLTANQSLFASNLTKEWKHMPEIAQGKCDILIFTGNYGMGHIQVSEALQSSILEANPTLNVEIYDFFRIIDPLLSHVVEFGYHQIIKYFSPGYSLFYKATQQIAPDSSWQKHLNSIGHREIDEFIQKKSPKAIICTFPTPAGVIAELKKEGKVKIPLITVITDVAVHSQWLHPQIDFYFVAAESVAQHMEYRGISRHKIFVTGIPLRAQFQNKYDKEATLLKYGLSPSLPTILVSGGGKGMLTGITEIARKLGKFRIPLQAIVVTGQNKALYRRLQLQTHSARNPICVLGYVENMAELMESCDIMITKAGGITVFEALAKGIPMIIYKPIPGHEESNVQFLLQNGAARAAKNWRQIKTAIEELIFFPSLYERICEHISRISKPNATREATEIILKILKNEDLYTLSHNRKQIEETHWRYA
jgi:processive 1,2-diacylglycerol beta-glucosyltransferase